MRITHGLQNGVTFRIAYCLAAIAFAVLFWQCEENPQDVTLTERVSQLTIDTIYANNSNTHRINRRVSTLSADRLHLGSTNGYTFRSILRFAGLPDSIVIDSAWIKFQSLGISKEKNITPVEFSVPGFPIINPWVTDTSDVWDDYASNVDFTNSMGEVLVTTADSGAFFFNFNEFGLQRLNAWVDTASGIPNNGLALDLQTQTPNFVKEFQGRNAANVVGPLLFIRYQAEMDTVINDTMTTILVDQTDSLLSISDAFFFDGKFEKIPDRVHTTTLDTPLVSVLSFNLDTLKRIHPAGVIIESVNIQLPVDWDNTLLNSSLGNNIHILPLTSEVDNDSVRILIEFISNGLDISLSQFTIDSTYLEVPDGIQRALLGSQYVQLMLNSPDFATGFYIEYLQQSQHFSTASFFRHDNSPSQLRPRLIITSLVLPDERL